MYYLKTSFENIEKKLTNDLMVEFFSLNLI